MDIGANTEITLLRKLYINFQIKKLTRSRFLKIYFKIRSQKKRILKHSNRKKGN